MTLKFKLQTSNFPLKLNLQVILMLVRFTISKLRDKVSEKCRKEVPVWDLYKPHTQFKSPLKALTHVKIKSTDPKMYRCSILHDCLKDWFGVDATVLTWMDSYSTSCKQKIKLGTGFLRLFIFLLAFPKVWF